MKLIDTVNSTTMNEVSVVIKWGDHAPGCEHCRSVDIERSSTFTAACALGSKIIMEEMQKRQAPVVAEKRKAVEEWAKSTGAFNEFDHKAKHPPTKYK